MPISTLAAIQTKIRRLTRSPSEALLTTSQINEAVNTFYLYDMPEHLRLFDLHTTITFYTAPNIDTYDPVAISDPTSPFYDPTSPLYDFNNRYITVNQPVYIAGYNSLYLQSRETLFSIYPLVSSIARIASSGDGVTTAFSGTLTNIPVLANDVLFTSVDANNDGLVLRDVPISSEFGNLYVPNDLTTSYGLINYLTGTFSFDFPTAPASGEAIYSQTLPYNASLPQAVLYYDGKFIVRPVPDKVYPITLEAYQRPTELLDTSQNPELKQWWQYIAVASSIKILYDRMDLETIEKLMPYFKEQEQLVLRRTIVQNTTQRTQTIYAQQTGFYGWWGSTWGANGQF